MTTETPPEEASTESLSPGAALKQERNRKGLSLAEMAQSLKITERYVQALEENAFDDLPQLAFVRGYIRNYARLLEMDAEAVIQGFDDFAELDSEALSTLKGGSPEQRLRAHSAPSPLYALALLVIILLGGASYFVWNSYLSGEALPGKEFPGEELPGEALPGDALVDESDELLTPDSQVQVGSESSLELMEEAVPAQAPETGAETSDKNGEPDSASTDEQLSVSPVESPSSEPSSSAIEEEVETAPVEPAVEPGVPLFMRFSQDCWVEIRDADVKILISSVQKAGTSINLHVVAPVSVRLGNAPGVSSILFDGKPVGRPGAGKRVASLLLKSGRQG